MPATNASFGFNYSQGKEDRFYNGSTVPKARIDENGRGIFKDISVDNAIGANTLGGLVRAIEVFDKNGNSTGFVPVYKTADWN